jgi:pyruvate formate lyase activating enzyme
MPPSEPFVKGETICVSQIQHFSVNDGEGIRSTVFLSGCPLRCRWCCNPETWTPEPKSGRLPGGKEETFGRFLTVDEVMKELARHTIFYRESGGGVTWSGGEPFFFPGNLRALAMACGERGISQAAETSCSFDWEECEDIVRLLDFVFADIKHMDGGIHRDLTGADNERILSNLKRLGETGPETVVRVPLLSGVNDDEENIGRTARFVREHFRQPKIELLPYHTLGRAKYRMLGMDEFREEFETPPKERVASLEALIRSEEVEPVRYR